MIGTLLNYTSRMFGSSRSGTDAVPLEETEFIVLDTELTGLQAKKDSIVSIGAVRMRGGRIILGETFERLVEPRTELSGRSVVIHEITPTEAAASPGIGVVLPELLAFLGNAVVAGHVVSIDLQFLNREMKRLYGRPLPHRAVDTFQLYRWIRQQEEAACAYHEGGPEFVDLFSLAKKYGIPVQQAHNALSDAFVTAQLLQRLLAGARRRGITTLNDLLKIGSP